MKSLVFPIIGSLVIGGGAITAPIYAPFIEKAIEDSKEPQPIPPIPPQPAGECFTVTALEDSTFNFQDKDLFGYHRSYNFPDIKYSFNGGESWTQYPKDGSTPNIQLRKNEVVSFKGLNPNGFYVYSPYIECQYCFVFTGKVSLSGNIMSIVDDGECKTTIIPENSGEFFRCFFGFSGTTDEGEPIYYDSAIVDASNLVLAATESKSYCAYDSMFKSCINLVNPPQIMLETPVENDMEQMFMNCYKLETAPVLHLNRLAYGSCWRMFFNCTSLVVPPPSLPGRIEMTGCQAMFVNCTSLEAAPELFGTTLSQWSYESMFSGCTSLKTIKIHYTDSFTSNNYFSNWVSGVGNTGTFYYNGTDTTRGASAIPPGWDIVPF